MASLAMIGTPINAFYWEANESVALRSLLAGTKSQTVILLNRSPAPGRLTCLWFGFQNARKTCGRSATLAREC